EAFDLWIEDRNFCTLGFIFGVAQRGGFVLVREHENLPWQAKSELSYMGRTETGRVYEQRAMIQDWRGAEAGQAGFFRGCAGLGRAGTRPSNHSKRSWGLFPKKR